MPSSDQARASVRQLRLGFAAIPDRVPVATVLVCRDLRWTRALHDARRRWRRLLPIAHCFRRLEMRFDVAQRGEVGAGAQRHDFTVDRRAFAQRAHRAELQAVAARTQDFQPFTVGRHAMDQGDIGGRRSRRRSGERSFRCALVFGRLFGRHLFDLSQPAGSRHSLRQFPRLLRGYMPMAVRYTQPTLPLTSYLIRYQSPRRPVTETRVPCSTRATTAPSRLADERTSATSHATVAWPDASVTSADAASPAGPAGAASPFSMTALGNSTL